MNYEFHVGDYVETKTGTIGYISNLPQTKHGFPLWTVTKLSKVDALKEEYVAGDGYAVDFPIFPNNRFKRIGQYDFTKKDEGKIEPLDYTERFICESTVNTTLISYMKKINELVEAVNELRNKND